MDFRDFKEVIFSVILLAFGIILLKISVSGFLLDFKCNEITKGALDGYYETVIIEGRGGTSFLKYKVTYSFLLNDITYKGKDEIDTPPENYFDRQIEIYFDAGNPNNNELNRHGSLLQLLFGILLTAGGSVWFCFTLFPSNERQKEKRLVTLEIINREGEDHKGTKSAKKIKNLCVFVV